MQALILAAGRGSRLGTKSTEVPKCLLEVGRRPLIEHQLELLADGGVGPVGMVLGYCADEIREIVGIRAEYIDNSRWKATNSLYSFWLARDWVKGPVVILNCDILLHPEILDRLLAAKGDAIAFDSSSGDGREHMKVRVVNGCLVSMSKTLSAAEVAGENVGILKFTAETAQALFQRAQTLINAGEQKQWLGSAVCQIAQDRTIRAVDVAGLPWGEIDFPYDLDRVRKEVWPTIRRAAETRRRRRRWRLLQPAAVAGLLILLGVSGFRAWLSPTVESWETVEIEDAERTKITNGERTQSWLRITSERTAEMAVTGPGPVRIDSRLLIAAGASDEFLYVLEVQLDGARLDWFKETGRPSGTWRHDSGGVAKRRRISLELPPGPHTLGVRLVAADGEACLIRVRQEVPDEDPEE